MLLFIRGTGKKVWVDQHRNTPLALKCKPEGLNRVVCLHGGGVGRGEGSITQLRILPHLKDSESTLTEFTFSTETYL